MNQNLTEEQHWTITRLAFWYLDRGRFKEAEILARGLLAINQRDGMGWFYYGEARRQQNDLNGASRGYREAASLLGARPDVWLRLGDCLLRLGRRDEARQALDQARACCGDDAAMAARIRALRALS